MRWRRRRPGVQPLRQPPAKANGLRWWPVQTGAALVALPLAAFALWRSRQMAVRLERHSDSLRKLREAAAAGQVLQGRHDELLRRLEGQHTRLSSLEGRLEDLLGAERDLAAQLAALRETMEREHGPRGPDTQAVIDPATEEWERQLEQCLSALHSGDRAYLRGCGAREMNLTQASKEDLAVGTDTPPQAGACRWRWQLSAAQPGGTALVAAHRIHPGWLPPPPHPPAARDLHHHRCHRRRPATGAPPGLPRAGRFAVGAHPAGGGGVPRSAASRASRRASRRLSRSRRGSAGG